MTSDLPFNELSIKNLKDQDIDGVMSFFRKFTGRDLLEKRLGDSVRKYPCCIIFANAEIIGFSYTNRFAPDILELSNIFVHPEFRSHGIGGMMLKRIEKESLKGGYTGLILVNSLLYDNRSDKRFATNFYVKNGYLEIVRTESSKVFFKSLA
nr:GNAT family N-acetyltransferase [Allomuricauda sp.]